jgi:hypothetical protein
MSVPVNSAGSLLIRTILFGEMVSMMAFAILQSAPYAEEVHSEIQKKQLQASF